MNTEIVNKLHLHNYSVNNRGYVFKYSQSTKSKEVAGQLNNAGVYFYAQNVQPFKQGQNTFKDILGDNVVYTPYLPIVQSNEVDHYFTFEEYINTTKSKNQLSIYLTPYLKNLHSELDKNTYDIRGVKSGYLEDATLFPYINFDNEFVTAKIVKYNTNTGKRSKAKFSNNWFHAYKPIKKELEIKETISKKVDCFFGEYLLPFNNKPVVIVESEKTAIFLSLLYPEIIFLATGGLNKLKTLQYDFLANREVYVYPDNGAKEWFKIANKRGWWSSSIIENKGTPGSDVVDYFDTEIGNELGIELDRIARGEIKIVSDNLNFSLKEKRTTKYCLPNLNTLGLNYYEDNAKGESFKGENFTIYENEFQVLNANIDFNKYQLSKNRFTSSKSNNFIPVDANEFLNRLEESFRITKHLNPNTGHKKEFSKVLAHLLEHSNYLFNAKYIERELLPSWDCGTNDISEYYKYRNWRFHSKNHIEDKEFQKLLNNDRKAYKTNNLLLHLQPLLNNREYIKPIDINLKSRESNSFIWDIIKDYNLKVLGCNTINNYNKKVEIQKYFHFIEETANILEAKEKSFGNFRTTYYNSNIVCEKSGTVLKLPNIQTIHDNTFIDKHTIREYLNFVPDENKLLEIKVIVSYLLDNPMDLKFERINRRIIISPLHNLEYMQNEVANSIENVKDRKEISLQDAFNYDLDLTDSILQVDEIEAVQRGNQFLYSWICFHNPELTENDKLYIDINPMDFLLRDNYSIAA
jgi:hypothetical protein